MSTKYEKNSHFSSNINFTTLKIIFSEVKQRVIFKYAMKNPFKALNFIEKCIFMYILKRFEVYQIWEKCSFLLKYQIYDSQNTFFWRKTTSYIHIFQKKCFQNFEIHREMHFNVYYKKIWSLPKMRKMLISPKISILRLSKYFLLT